MDIITTFSPEGWRYREQTRKERKGGEGEVGGVLSVRSLNRVLWEEDASRALAWAVCSDMQLLLTQETLEGQDRGEARWWLYCPHGAGSLRAPSNTQLMVARSQKILKFMLNCPQYKILSLSFPEHTEMCTHITFFSVCTELNPFLLHCAASSPYFLLAVEELFNFIPYLHKFVYTRDASCIPYLCHRKGSNKNKNT